MLIQAERDVCEASTQRNEWKNTSSTLQVIADLFPSPTLGLTFATRFIERAATERSLVPDLQQGDAFICAKSIAHLGKELGLSNDTTDKYVVLFKSLGLLEKRKIPGGLAFVLFLGIYHPPATLEANLDYLLTRSEVKKSRGKFHRLLMDVKQRCQVYGLISQDLMSSLQHVRTLLHVDPQGGMSRKRLEQRIAQAQHLVSTLIMQEMTRPLPQAQSWVDSTQHVTSHLHLSGVQERSSATQIAESTQQGEEKEHPSRNLPSLVAPVVEEEHRQTLASTTGVQAGNFLQEQTQLRLPSLEVRVASLRGEVLTTSTPNTQSGRFVQEPIQSNPPFSNNQVDSLQKEGGPKSTSSTQTGRFSTDLPSKRLPEALKKVDSQDLPNVNVGNVITENINVNVGIVTALLCHIFGEPLSKQGIYRKLIIQEQCNQPEAILAAILYSLVRFHRDGTINNAASVYIARCREYHKSGVPEEATNFITQYGQLTHQQFLDEMRKPVVSQGLQRITPQSTTPVSLSPVPQATDLQPCITMNSSGGMVYSEAQQLRTHIAHDRRVGLCRTGIIPLQDHTYAVLLDNTVSTTVRQVAVYSSDEWQRQYEAMCTQLFASRSDHPGRQQLRHLLKRGESL